MPDRIDLLPAATEAKALRTLDHTLGRDALVAAIELQHDSPETPLGMLAGLLADPDNARTSLALLAKRAGTTLKEVLEAYRSGLIVQAQTSAMAVAAEKVEAIMADVVDRSLPKEESCAVCSGLGTLVDDDGAAKPCVVCKGRGWVLAEPDFDRQKFVLESFELGPKKGGGTQVNVAVTQQTALLQGGMGRAFHALQAATDKILYHGPGGGARLPGGIGIDDNTLSSTGVGRTTPANGHDRGAPPTRGGSHAGHGERDPGDRERSSDGHRTAAGSVSVGELAHGHHDDGHDESRRVGGVHAQPHPTPASGDPIARWGGLPPPPGSRPARLSQRRVSDPQQHGAGTHRPQDHPGADGSGTEAER